jgi:hypothetical protein
VKPDTSTKLTKLMLPNNPLPLNWDRLQFNACNGLEVGLGEGNPHFVVNNCNLNHVIFFFKNRRTKMV